MNHPQKARQSNFELLRIVAIALVLLHHMLIATGRVDYRGGHWRGMEPLNALAVVGVNCFVLISGYFGIKLRASKVAYLLWLIVGVVMVDGILALLLPAWVDFRYAATTITPFIRGSNWFITCYFGLMLFAPLLNGGITTLGRRGLPRAATALVGLSVLAYVTGNRTIGAHGYGMVHLLALYVLGAALRNVRLGRMGALAVYLGGAAIGVVVAATWSAGYVAFSYNSPWVLMSSVGLFLLFKDLRFQARWINWWARSVFTTFLLSYAVMQHLVSERACTFAQKGAEWVALYVAMLAIGALVHSALQTTFAGLQRLMKRQQ